MASEYKIAIKRLVVVDSAGFSYIEIPLDDHAILLASGNVGKSSILNSLRLFMLPEENFQKSRIKFGFRTANRLDFYKNEDSYNHYFPSQRSFIILEVENSSGTHCQILYRGDVSSLGYKRVFVPCPYAEIRESFWDIKDPDGIGFANAELSSKKIIERCKAISQKTQLVSDKKMLRSLLYSNDILDVDKSRYAILPMSHVDNQKVESLRTLIRMLFEVSHDSKSMALAVANIIENQKNYERDRFDFNINEFLQDRDRIDNDERQLNVVKGKRGLYKDLIKNFQDYDPKSLSETYALWVESLRSALEKTSAVVSETDEAVSRLSRLERSKNDQKRASGQTLLREQGAFGKSVERKNRFQKHIDDAQPIITQYPSGHPVSEMREALEEEKRELEGDLEALQNQKKDAETRAGLTKDIADLDHRINLIKDRQRNAHYQIENQVSGKPEKVLPAINKSLMAASPNRELTQDELQCIGSFCDLFEVQDNQVWFFDTIFDERSVVSASREAKLEDLEAERRYKVGKLLALKHATENPAEKVRQINSLTKKIKVYTKDLERLENFDGAEKQVRDLTKEIEESQEGLAILKEKNEEDKNAHKKSEDDLVEARSKLNRYKEEKTRFQDMMRTLDNLGEIQKKLHVGLADDSKKRKLLDPEQLTRDGIDDIQRQCFQMSDVRDQILDGFRKFLELKILGDEYTELTSLRPSNEMIRKAWIDIKDVYNNLEQREKSIADHRRTHNELVENYRTSLRKNRDFITNVQGQLNRSLEHVRINDLAEIKVTIECDDAFESLVRQSEQINPYTSKSLSDAFYDQLKTFMNRFFQEAEDGTAEYRLTMEKVIKSISYKTRKDTQSSFDDKSQSNSTTSLINLSLVQNLLMSLLDKGYDYSLPAVLDEVASVDISQIEPLLRRIKQDGFRLFGAATHSASGAVVLEIGRHFKLDEMKTSKPYDSERVAVYWGGPEGLVEGDLNTWIQPEQRALLASSEGPEHVE